MSRHDRQRLDDVLAAIDAIRAHLARGELSDGLVFDAVRARLIEIGEAVKSLPTSHAILTPLWLGDLPEIELAVRRLIRYADDG